MYCPKCGKSITPEKVTLLPKAGAAGGAVGGGYLGAHLGIAALGGAVSGLLPLALIGAGAAYLCLKDYRKCPCCKEFFKV